MTAVAERGSVRKFLNLVMIEHSVFTLPLRLHRRAHRDVGADTVGALDAAVITLATVAARTVAMSANRILDRGFDAQNPRPARREFVTGELTVRTAGVGTAVARVLFLASAAALSWLWLLLAPVAVVLLVVYSYGKRFTDFPQVMLALAQFVAPVGAWIAVTGHSV